MHIHKVLFFVACFLLLHINIQYFCITPPPPLCLSAYSVLQGVRWRNKESLSLCICIITKMETLISDWGTSSSLWHRILFHKFSVSWSLIYFTLSLLMSEFLPLLQGWTVITFLLFLNQSTTCLLQKEWHKHNVSKDKINPAFRWTWNKLWCPPADCWGPWGFLQAFIMFHFCHSLFSLVLHRVCVSPELDSEDTQLRISWRSQGAS